jgi:putative effector of murein hydrolase LrgA (UPF0299 family)
MKTRIISNWRTTLIGICLFIASLVFVILKFITVSEFAAFLPAILGLIYVPDSVLKIRKGD